MAPLLLTAVMKGLVFKVPLSESVKLQDGGTEVSHHAKVREGGTGIWRERRE